MADMTVDEAMEKYGPSKLSRDDLLVLDDPEYAPENVVIVTGGGAGIGRATALAFAANGLTVAATDRDEDGLAAVKAEAEELDLPGEVVTIGADLTDDDDLGRIVEEAADQGSVRYLINNAGLQTVAPIESFPIEKPSWKRTEIVEGDAESDATEQSTPETSAAADEESEPASESGNGLSRTARVVGGVAVGVVGLLTLRKLRSRRRNRNQADEDTE